jgi:hypothetical protein
MKRTEPDDRFWSDGTDMTIVEPKKRPIKWSALQPLILVLLITWVIWSPGGWRDQAHTYFEAHFDAIDKKFEIADWRLQVLQSELAKITPPNPVREGLSSHDEQGRPFPIDGNYDDPEYEALIKQWSKTHPTKEGDK